MAACPHDDDSRTLGALVAIAVGAFLLWGLGHPEPPRSEQIATCADGLGLPCSFTRADGTRMVRTLHPERGVEEITAADFDESYLSWLEEMAPQCPVTGIGPTSGC